MKRRTSVLFPVAIGIVVGAAMQASFILGLYFQPAPSPPINIYQYQQPIYSLKATVTAYTNRVQETNCDPENTATMERAVVGGTCAVSRDLMHWLGGRIYIEGVGVRRVNDLMNARFERSVDIFVGDVKQAKEFGRQEKQVIFLGR